MPHFVPSARVAAVRRFNRFYTARADLLGDRHQVSPFSLGEMRVLFEIAHRELPTAAELCRDLRLDAGYLSRVLRDFRKRGLVTRTASTTDAREALLALTPKGQVAFAPFDEGAARRMRAMLGDLPAQEQQSVITAMHAIEFALGSRSAAQHRASHTAALTPAPITLRRPLPGDLGWVVHRHGTLYASEYGYDERFEGLVSKVVGEFVDNFDAKRERCWIADVGGVPVGSVFLVKKTDTVAKLRLLLIDPAARGHGLGKRLVRECTNFARSRGYEVIELWTQSELLAARTLYEREGYALVATETHAMFGSKGVAETWRLELKP